ncbi:hypothetical protein [Desulfovibrio ferrophilus]|uniref:HPr kinase n=1 Tax=Desulfovibrio ferrophilus TaxID=241368 RepID=A0A2Z6B155_9BACT|nr:hypothetical protein [Desulfovibrio ferrophilus]BBD09249.1 uncharacterized protein DFE_2523 [Desulfovibrio ferrophilus]
MSVTRYDLLGLAAVDSHDAPEVVAHELEARLGRFAVPAGGERVAEIDLAPLPAEGMPGLAPDHLQSQRGFTLTTVEGHSVAVLPYRAQADIVLLPGDPLRIRYAPRPGVAGKLSALLQYALQCVLLRRDSAMFHGAALVRDGRGLVLTGLQGARKTLVMLNLLRQGWDFLADDRFLLQAGRAHMFHDSIPLMPHHFAALPWLEGQGEAARNFARRAGRMRGIARWCERHIPSYLTPRLAKFHNAPLMVRPDDLFPDCKAVAEAPVSDVVMLVGGITGCKELDLPEAVEPLSIILDVEFQNYLRMALELKVRGVELCPPTVPVLERGLTGARVVELGVPEAASVDETVQEVLRCIARA